VQLFSLTLQVYVRHRVWACYSLINGSFMCVPLLYPGYQVIIVIATLTLCNGTQPERSRVKGNEGHILPPLFCAYSSQPLIGSHRPYVPNCIIMSTCRIEQVFGNRERGNVSLAPLPRLFLTLFCTLAGTFSTHWLHPPFLLFVKAAHMLAGNAWYAACHYIITVYQ